MTKTNKAFNFKNPEFKNLLHLASNKLSQDINLIFAEIDMKNEQLNEKLRELNISQSTLKDNKPKGDLIKATNVLTDYMNHYINELKTVASNLKTSLKKSEGK